MFNQDDAAQQWQNQMQAMQAMAGMGAGMAAPTADASALPTIPGLDPNMAQAAQAYLAMMQLSAQQGMGMGGMGMPFPAMPPMPYAGAPATTEPTVAVSVEGMKFQYQLTEDDIHKVFSRYGGIKRIQVDDAGAAARITFDNYQDGQNAVSDLNGKVLNGLDGTLRVQWANNQAGGMQNPFPPMPYPSLPFGGMPFPGAPAAAGAADGSAGGADGKLQKGVRKFTCRFLIGIENDKDFQVARRIIGPKGANMKKIVKDTEAKLRLRGVGSGYFEGAGQKESSEPLQLCVSCTNSDHYSQTIRRVEDLLKRTYEEYRAYCMEVGKEVPDLQINCSENQLVYSAARPGGNDFDDAAGGSPGKGAKGGGRLRARPVAKTAGGEVERGEPGPNAPPEPEIEKMIEMRNEARRASNFAEADRVRQALHARGVALMDEPGGRGRGTEVTTWRYWRD